MSRRVKAALLDPRKRLNIVRLLGALLLGPPPTGPGEHIFLTGDVPELGSFATTWDAAVGPMLSAEPARAFIGASVPAGRTIRFTFFVLNDAGNVVREASAGHAYIVPESGVGSADVAWQ